MNREKTEQRSEHVTDGWFSRERILPVVLLIATAFVFYLCWLLIQPFVAVLSWAVALAVIGRPMHEWIAAKIPRKGLAAGLAVLIVALVIVLPGYFVTQSLVGEAIEGGKLLREVLATGRWQAVVSGNATLESIFQWLRGGFNPEKLLEQAAAYLSTMIMSAVGGSVTVMFQLLIVLFSLFYFFRDRAAFGGVVRGLLPLSQGESRKIFRRVSETIHATIYGTLAVAFIQGLLGGLMFWWLGLPVPILWGVVMALLAVVPIFGAFMVWIPAALLLALEGDWTKAIILTLWGSVVVGLVDNLLYPVFVGNRIRLHTLPVFFSIVGGLIAFGASGLIVGPVVLSVADGLVHLWRVRMDRVEAAEAEAAS